jgi:electron transport complex protein RnfB
VLIATAIVMVGIAAAMAMLLLRARGADSSNIEIGASINALLPQTQCGQCGYAGCQPYAEAIARHEVPINQCPPGGAATIRNLADLLGEDPLPLNPAIGHEQPPQVVVIDEDVCIGCVKCIQACPVDAIVGAPKLMHTVVTSYCTGCELCIPPCPVDCIAVRPLAIPPAAWKWPRPEPAPA